MEISLDGGVIYNRDFEYRILTTSVVTDELFVNLVIESNNRVVCSAYDSKMLFADGLDHALLGVVKYGKKHYSLYDFDTALSILVEHYPDKPDEFLEDFIWDNIILNEDVKKTPWFLL